MGLVRCPSRYHQQGGGADGEPGSEWQAVLSDLKFSPLSSSLPLKSPDGVLVLSHSWVLRVEMGVTQERTVLAVDSPAGHRDLDSLRRTRLPS